MKVVLIVAFFGIITAASAYEPKCPKNSNSGKKTLLPNPEDCTSYFTCLRGTATLTSCPKGLHFSPISLECKFPKYAGCQDTTTTTTTTTPKPENPKNPVECPKTSSPSENMLLPNPDDCGSYYHCSNGYPWLQYCPPGLHFNAEKENCDWSTGE